MSESLRESVKAAYDEVVNNVAPETKIEEIESEQTEDQQEPSSPPEPEIEAPVHWANDDREVFKSLDKKGRDFLLRRHKEMEAAHTKKMQERAEDIKTAENYRKIIQPHEGYIKQIGFDPLEAVNKLIGAEIKLRMGSAPEKVAILQDLAKQYGVQFNNSDTQPEVDEKTRLIFHELQEQKNTLMQLKHEKEQAENRTLLNHIQSFASQTDEKGLPKYPHFETIKADMGLLMQNGKAESLEDAYEQAIFLNKSLRDEYIMRQNKPEARKKAGASGDANFNVKSESTAKLSDARPDETLRQTLKRAMDEQKRKRI